MLLDIVFPLSLVYFLPTPTPSILSCYSWASAIKYLTWTWRDGWVVKNDYCFCIISKFGSQHVYYGSQLPVTSGSGDVLFRTLGASAHIYTHKSNKIDILKDNYYFINIFRGFNFSNYYILKLFTIFFIIFIICYVYIYCLMVVCGSWIGAWFHWFHWLLPVCFHRAVVVCQTGLGIQLRGLRCCSKLVHMMIWSGHGDHGPEI